jgi:hypothetical protein
MSSGNPQTGHKVDKQDIKGLINGSRVKPDINPTEWGQKGANGATNASTGTRHEPAKPVTKGQKGQDSTVENETFMRHMGHQG